MKEDEFTSYLEFESEDGETITLAVLDYFTYKDELYALLCDDCDCDDFDYLDDDDEDDFIDEVVEEEVLDSAEAAADEAKETTETVTE